MNKKIAQEETVLNENLPVNWVPAGFPMAGLMSSFLSYAINANSNFSQAEFINWQINNDARARNAAIAYCFPLTTAEFRMYNRSLEDIKVICTNGIAGLIIAIDGRNFDQDVRNLVCLVDCYLVGRMMQSRPGWSATQRNQFLIDRGFAGTITAARTLRSVGFGTGLFFGLLNQVQEPTDQFNLILNGIGINDAVLGVNLT